MFGALPGAGYAKAPGFIIAVLLSALLWVITLLMAVNLPETRNAEITIWLTGGIALLATLVTARHLLARILKLGDRLSRSSTVVHINTDGIYQTGADGTETRLKWDDIRLVQHRRSVHIVRGREKKQEIEISTRRRGHETMAAFLKFAFLFRQEFEPEWRGLLQEVRSRIDGPGFQFHYDSDRSDTVHIGRDGIKRTTIDGIEHEMAWGHVRESVVDRSAKTLKFRHPETRTSIAIPLGTDSDYVIAEFIRWALHTNPVFSDRSS